ncbi:ZIP-like iron-zinc transporter [Coprinellus micaceus]|uniref:ZIP-like iron-zinc transporter n=1 Tax=Coprinellus micaceus TaxID=71717 RepID=A0A4Y7TKR2_COPMI|nr:ZIP-like iron-zinc transporter [Coprinellus micaceus]
MFSARRILLGLALLVAIYTSEVLGKEASSGKPGATESILSVYENEIQQCPPIQSLSALKVALEDEESPVMRKVFAVLFPFGPAWNSVLATFYISSVPNFILAFIPAQVNANTLNTMTAFATGGLLSDVFLHLIPHAFMGESQAPGVHFLIVEEKRNILIGLAIFVGFASFFFMEKTLRVLSSDEEEGGHSHSHSHSHSIPPHKDAEPTSVTSGIEKSSSPNGLKQRRKDKTEVHGHDAEPEKPSQGPSKLSAYLNLFGDFVHNITDGLAMAASFYASPAIGATTTLACFAHEIPHEIADYSILVRSGFTKRQAMQSQFITAIGAFHVRTDGFFQSNRTFIGIAVHNAAATGAEEPLVDLAAGVRQDATGLIGTTAQLADLVIPFVAGGFLYIGAVAVLPTLLSESKGAKQAMREFAAMGFGVLCMFAVAWNE